MGPGRAAAVGWGLARQPGPGVFPSTGSGPGPAEQMLTHISTVQGRKSATSRAGAWESWRHAAGPSDFPGWELGLEGEGAFLSLQGEHRDKAEPEDLSGGLWSPVSL
jgi:hypothetical protein